MLDATAINVMRPKCSRWTGRPVPLPFYALGGAQGLTYSGLGIAGVAER